MMRRGVDTGVFVAASAVASVAAGYLLLSIGAGALWAFVLVIALPIGYAVSKKRGWAHPLAWFSVAFALYFLIGSRNWIAVSDSNVDFRNHVSGNALRLPVLGYAAFVAGVLLAEVVLRGSDTSPPRQRRPGQFEFAMASAYAVAARVCFGLGLLTLAVIIRRMGVPLFHPSTRSDVPGFLRLGSSLLVPAGILAAERLVGRERITIVVGSILGLVLLAYRTPVLLLLVTIGCLSILRRRLTAPVALICALVLVGGSTALYTFRVAHGNGTASGVQAVGVLRYAPMLTPLYYSYAREGVAVWARISSAVPSSTPFFGGRVQESAFLSLLPGHQASPRLIVSALAYQTSTPATTLTPTIVGGPYLDFGPIGVGVELLALGFALTWMYKRAVARPADGVLTRDIAYAYAAALVLLSIHTGLLDGVLLAALPALTMLIVWACALGSHQPARREGFGPAGFAARGVYPKDL